MKDYVVIQISKDLENHAYRLADGRGYIILNKKENDDNMETVDELE